MAITQFEQNTIDKAATSHSEMVSDLQARLNKLYGVVENTLGTSPSAATRALEATYDSWIKDVEKMIISRVQSLSESMTKTAQSQADMDEQNSSDVSQVAQFING
jgi:hypothetical protein